MKRDSSSSDPASLERDPVWALLRESRGVQASPDFASRVARAARLEAEAKPWWSRLWIPVAAGASLAGAAAVVAVMITLNPGLPSGNGGSVAQAVPADQSLASLQEDFESEVLLEASDHLATFDDAELVSLIGF